MKKFLALVLTLAMALALVACGGNGNSSTNNGGSSNTGANTGDGQTDSSASGETIQLTVWGAEEDQALLSELVEKFKAAHPDQTFDITIGVESESTAKDTILTDVEAAAKDCEKKLNEAFKAAGASIK